MRSPAILGGCGLGGWFPGTRALHGGFEGASPLPHMRRRRLDFPACVGEGPLRTPAYLRGRWVTCLGRGRPFAPWGRPPAALAASWARPRRAVAHCSLTSKTRRVARARASPPVARRTLAQSHSALDTLCSPTAHLHHTVLPTDFPPAKAPHEKPPGKGGWDTTTTRE